MVRSRFEGRRSADYRFRFRFLRWPRGTSWEFPLLLKYRFSKSGLAPFASAGSTLRHLGDLKGKGYLVPSLLALHDPTTFDFPSGKPVDVGITTGAGVRIHAGPVHLIPEIRYTHWTALNLQPSYDRVEFLIGITR